MNVLHMIGPRNCRRWYSLIDPLISAKYLKKLTPEGLALGHKMAFSRKDRSDIIDDGYHR